jgi:hypothetical protein
MLDGIEDQRQLSLIEKNSGKSWKITLENIWKEK